MKISTRTTSWGIELKNDTITKEIYSSFQQELKETMINFLEAVEDMSTVLRYHQDFKDEIYDLIEEIIKRLEDI